MPQFQIEKRQSCTANWHLTKAEDNFREISWRNVNRMITKLQLDEPGIDSIQVGSDSAGQSRDTQGLSQIADAAGESVGELTDTDQAYEAEAVGGVEDAADHREKPIRSVVVISAQMTFRRSAENSGRDRRRNGHPREQTPA